MFNPTRDQARQFFLDTWAKRNSGQPLTQMETIALTLIGVLIVTWRPGFALSTGLWLVAASAFSGAVGAVLIPGAVAPHVLTREMLVGMEDGSVVVDISIDQGGCFETSRPTTWKEPTYVEEGVIHFCVTNMPGAVPQTSSQAICAAILPWVSKLASGAWRDSLPLVRGNNVEAGELVHPALKGMTL